MKQDEIIELCSMVEKFFTDKGYGINEILGFLTATYIGTMVKHGSSLEFFDKTAQRMRDKFMQKHNEKYNDLKIIK